MPGPEELARHTQGPKGEATGWARGWGEAAASVQKGRLVETTVAKGWAGASVGPLRHPSLPILGGNTGCSANVRRL